MRRNIPSELDELAEALEFNTIEDELQFHNIAALIAIHEGRKDEEDWHWVVTLKDGRFAYFTGGCDFTGWDCQSHLVGHIASGPLDAASLCEDKDIRQKLIDQVLTVRVQTWREMKNKEFGL